MSPRIEVEYDGGFGVFQEVYNTGTEEQMGRSGQLF